MMPAMKYIIALFICLNLFSVAVQAQNTPPKPLIQIKQSQKLGLPLDCKLNETCWVMNYVDFDNEEGVYTDPNCLSRTYDTHKGTDFMLLDEKAMINGVPVLATKDGKILRFRDGEPDNWKTNAKLDQIKLDRKECGNAILINHDDNTQSVYCHLRKNSIIVKKDQRVQKGDVIAMVGMSGLSEFPHLHYGYIDNKQVIDPFTGRNAATSCGLDKAKPLWDKSLNLTYQPLAIQTAGFTNEVPTLQNLSENAKTLTTLNFSDNKIIFWAMFLGVRINDQITLEIIDPNNKILVSEEITQDRNRARQLYYIGKKLDNTKLLEGAYSAITKIKRPQEDGQTIEERKFATILVTQ